MRSLVVAVGLLAAGSGVVELGAEGAPAESPGKSPAVPSAAGGGVAAESMARRSPQYDYDVPEPGTYELPVLQPAADGTVLGSDGKPVRLHELFEGRATVLSFIYTQCADPKACLAATGALSELQRLSREVPELTENLLLVTLSFDPATDTPEVMARYGRVSLPQGEGAGWLFLTTRNQKDLQPLLEAYGQRVDRRQEPNPLGDYFHPLRVYLIDPQRKIRNIYSYGLLDPRLVARDAQTVLMEGAAENDATGEQAR